MLVIFVIFLQASSYSLAFGEYVFEGAESVVLPCQYSGPLPEENPTVIWRRHDLKPPTIHLRREEDDLRGQNQRFSGRTSMKSDALDSGDFSLSLKKPHLSDSGIYSCSIGNDREEISLTDVQLEVKVQQVKVKVQEGVEFAILPCKTTAYLEEDATVEWTRSEPEFMIAYVYGNDSNKVKDIDKLFCDRTEMSKDKVKRGDLSLTLRYPTERDTGVYICTTYRKGHIVRQKVILHLLKEIFSSWAKAFLILLIILLVFGGLLVHFRQYLKSVYKVEVNSQLDSVTLPCKSITCVPEDVTIRWRNNTGQIVHSHQGSSTKLEEQHKRYKERTELKKSLKCGDFSLILKNPTDKDTNIYTCTISNTWGKILVKKEVLLKVRAGADSFIIAIDIGSAYTGYALYVNPHEKGGETQIKRWGKELGLDSPKAPTCILLDEHKKFLKFGYEAKTAYNNMKKEEAEKHYFFENIKMGLNCRNPGNQKVEAADGKSMKAFKVFTELLRYLKDDALDTITANATVGEIEVSDFSWVLNVPASWGHEARQFLKDSAMQAGLVTEGTKGKLTFALDSEAALAWCLKLPPDSFIKESHSRDSLDQSAEIRTADLSSGDPSRSQATVNIDMEPEESANLLKGQTNMKRFVVVDCGDETINFTAHEVLEGGVLQKLSKFPGNEKGGKNVLNKFKQFLGEIFCDGVWEEYEGKYQSEVQKMLNDFTRLKRVDEEIPIRCPYNLGELAEKKKDIEMFFESVEGASWDEGSIRITRERLKSFFAESLQGITESLREIFTRDSSIGSIVLVGGLAESQIIHQHIIKQFGDQYKVLVPFRPQEAVLKGAIELGRNPQWVESKKKPPAWLKCFSEKF